MPIFYITNKYTYGIIIYLKYLQLLVTKVIHVKICIIEKYNLIIRSNHTILQFSLLHIYTMCIGLFIDYT